MEKKVKKRGWVKDAAIVFLVILLILTFFSNTIMNRSLPEVAAQYVQSGSITTQIRGTAAVTPNEVYQVCIPENRVVKTVAIKTGQQVSVGDVLFILEEGDSSELANAKDTLVSLQLQYRKSLLTATSFDYSKENRDIQQARDALNEAIEDRDAITVTDEDIAVAKSNTEKYETELADAQKTLSSLEESLAALGGGSSVDTSLIESQIAAKRVEKQAAENSS